MTELESLHRLALDYRTAQDYPATKKAWAELEAYVLHLARGHEAAEHGLALLNEAWGAVPARYQAPPCWPSLTTRCPRP